MPWKKHLYRVGSHSAGYDDLPGDLDAFTASARVRIEPWLSAVFQAEHLNLLLGSGVTTSIALAAGCTATGMTKVTFGTTHDAAIDAHAQAAAKAMNRGVANIEDQFRSALALHDGLTVLASPDAVSLKTAMNTQMTSWLGSLLQTERSIREGKDKDAAKNAGLMLQSFLLSFASRTASRERLHIFTTNYDRLVEHGCDLTGLRIIDRFVGALNPIFRASRIEADFHYNPPGIRGEPRFMEGVVRLTKLHGSLDWIFDQDERQIHRKGIPFGAFPDHTDLPKSPIDTVMIYPNPAKDIETTQYPYAELFRDFAAAICRPNAVVVTYGYGFGDDHVNRVLIDMMSIPSTHLVVISYDNNERLKAFIEKTREAQVTLLVGPHFGDLTELVQNYLPKPALDYITGRMADLLRNRIDPAPPDPGVGAPPSGGTA